MGVNQCESVDKFDSVNEFELPAATIEAIMEAVWNQNNFPRVKYLSKSSSEYLYIVIYERDEKEIYNIVTYGERNIREFIKEIYSKPREELNYSQQSSLKKLNLFIRCLFYKYNLESIEIDGEEMSLNDDIDKFLQSMSKK